MPKPELLAPAGEWDALVAAVQNGADAVYLGGRNFSARQLAANFNREELARAVEYAHIRGVKIYVTVNTLIADEEMEEAADFLWFLHNTGVDAVIVQDLGLIRLAGRVVPGLELHASTQMTVHSTPAAKLLRDAGVKRIVLARELALEEIKEIKDRTGVEVEVFIHGALCICYSGQCLMSSMIGGRSGNRGLCAQPCRLQYRLEDEAGNVLASPEEMGEYLLSPRDLNLSANLPDLINAGVDSFKIEGRMKRPEYVATVTRIYRALIDRVLEGNFYIKDEEINELAQIFNRDFTTGYIYGRPGRDLMSCKRPNNRGVFLGRVKNYSRRKGLAEIKLEIPLRVGDGLEVWVSRGGRVGIEVDRILLRGIEVKEAGAGETVQIEVKGDIRPGDRVFKTHDTLLVKKARSTYASEKETRKIPLSFSVTAAVGKPLRIVVKDVEGFKGEAISTVLGEEARKRPLTEDFLLKQLDRLGNTPYSLQELSCDIKGEVMVPVREINEVRRRALEQLSENRARARRKEDAPEYVFRRHLNEVLLISTCRKEKENKIPSLAVAVSDLASLQAAVRAGADEIYFGGDGFRSRKKVTPVDIESARDFCIPKGVRLILSTPRIMHDREYQAFKSLWEKAFSLPLDGVLVSNLGFLELAGREGTLPIYGDFSLNVFNSQSAAFLLEKKVHRVTLSPELTLRQVREITRRGKFSAEVLVQGAVPLMVSRYCVLGGVLGGHGEKDPCSCPCGYCRARLRDRKGIIFPVEVDNYCRMHIFNSRELCMIENMGEILESGVSALRIDARLRDAESAEAVVRIYREAVDRFFGGAYGKDFSNRAKNELARYTPAGFTKGHYFRGVV